MGLDISKPGSVQVSVPVTLHIYDMGTDPEVQAMNRVLKVIGTGAFHCGAEIYGREWSFQGMRSGEDGTGIFWCRPKKCAGHTYHESVSMGVSCLSEDQVFHVIRRLQRAWPGKHYDILKFNCCHFVDSFCRALGLSGLPNYVLSLAGTGAAIADTGEYLEAQTMALAMDVQRSMDRAKEGCVNGCESGCDTSTSCVQSLFCAQSGNSLFGNSEVIDTVAEQAMVQSMQPSSEGHTGGSPQRLAPRTLSRFQDTTCLPGLAQREVPARSLWPPTPVVKAQPAVLQRRVESRQ